MQLTKDYEKIAKSSLNFAKPFAKKVLDKGIHVLFAFMAISMMMGSYTRKLLIHCLNEWLQEDKEEFKHYLSVKALLAQKYQDLESELQILSDSDYDSDYEDSILIRLIDLESQLAEMNTQSPQEVYSSPLSRLPYTPSIKGYAYTMAYLLAEEAKFLQLDQLVEKGWNVVQYGYKVLRALVRWTFSSVFVYLEPDYPNNWV